jgi:hypothetical protein
MKSTVPAWILVASWLFIAPAAAEHSPTNHHTGLVEAPLAGLRKAAQRGDRAELGRWAARIGVARLARALSDPDRSLVLAALDSVPFLPGRLLLLDAVLARCESADPQVKESALRTIGVLLDDTDPDLLDAWEIPAETTQAACRVLAAAAGSPDRAIDLRLAALQSLADASALCAAKSDLLAVLRDPSPEIRRAAVLVTLPTNLRGLSALREASKDPDASVASAAGAALCRQQLAPRVKSAPVPARPLRELVVAQPTPVEDAAEMLSCLGDSTDPADLKTLEDLRAKGSPLLRDIPKR